MSRPIGKERHVIALERLTVAQSPDSGEELGNWAALGNPFAEMSPLDGTEAAQRQLKFDQSPTRFLFRWSAAWNDFNPKDRITITETTGTRIYDVSSVTRFNNWRDRMEAIGTIRR